uniref:Uncharacterized protein n=1 Tax=Ciona savignyi TaxID=51511 RepID=H2Y8Q4_CIOSA
FIPVAIWSSIATSVDKLLSVVHFSVKVIPCLGCLYFISRVPLRFPLSLHDEPFVVNSCSACLGFQINFGGTI